MTTTHQDQQQSSRASGEAPSNGLTRFAGWGAWAAMVSGVALVVSFLMEWLVVPHERLGSEAFLTSSYLLSSGLRLLGFVLLLWGLIGIYGPQSRAAGTFGLWTFAVAFCGTALSVGNTWAEVFVWPTLAQAAPGMMSGSAADMSSYLIAGLQVSFPLFGLGLILYGAATFWAGVYPRWAAVLLIVSIPVTMFLDPTPGTFQESIGQILLGISVAALGLAFWKRSLVWGLAVINAAILIKVGWTFVFGTEAGAMSHLPAAVLGLVICDALILYIMRRMRARPSEPPRPAGHHG